MIYRVDISQQADEDLRSIYEYIAFELQSIQNAKGQLDRLEERIMGLEQLPNRFRRYDQEPCYSRCVRVMPVEYHCVFYKPDEQKGLVTVIRVIYAGRDMDHEFQM